MSALHNYEADEMEELLLRMNGAVGKPRSKEVESHEEP